MINLNKYNKSDGDWVWQFFNITNVFNLNNNNMIKISQLYNEVYGDIFSEDEITNILQQNIADIHYYSKYRFIDKENHNEIYIFDLLVDKKEIIINNNSYWFIYTYCDDDRIWKKLSKLNVIDGKTNNHIELNKKIDLIWELSKFIQTNIFLHLFRSFYVDINGIIINTFHLRFFNVHEYYSLSKEFDIWNKILENSNNYSDILMEKIDWQLLMIYRYDNDVYFQSKWSVTTLNSLLNNKYDKNWIFGSLIKIFDQNNINIELFNNLDNNWIVYHFEILHNENPVVQEYKYYGLYLLGGRYLNSFENIFNFKHWYEFVKNKYNELYSLMYNNLSIKNKLNISNLFFDIIIWNNQQDVEYKIKELRNPDNELDLNNYVIEWFVVAKWYIYFKVKNYQYFIKKLMKSFSYNKTYETIKWLSYMLSRDSDDLILYTNESLNWNIKDKEFINNTLNKVQSLRQNLPLKISYTRFIHYLKYEKTNDEINNILYNFKNDKEQSINIYKAFLVNSFIDVISWMLTSDREEISELWDILWLMNYELDYLLKSDNLKKEVKEIILNEIQNENGNKYLVNSIKEIINDIYSINI